MSKTINLDEKLECKGYWWLPNNPNETVAGVLTYILKFPTQINR